MKILKVRHKRIAKINKLTFKQKNGFDYKNAVNIENLKTYDFLAVSVTLTPL